MVGDAIIHLLCTSLEMHNAHFDFQASEGVLSEEICLILFIPSISQFIRFRSYPFTCLLLTSPVACGSRIGNTVLEEFLKSLGINFAFFHVILVVAFLLFNFLLPKREEDGEAEVSLKTCLPKKAEAC